MRFWIGVVSRDHVRAAVAGGFIQLGHGKRGPVEGLAPGDWIALYSPRTGLRSGEPVQAFTAIGRVREGEPYEFDQSTEFRPIRRDVAYLSSREAPIRPLLPSLTFLQDRPNWGLIFRRPVFSVSREDFERIAHAMGVERPLPAASPLC